MNNVAHFHRPRKHVNALTDCMMRGVDALIIQLDEDILAETSQAGIFDLHQRIARLAKQFCDLTGRAGKRMNELGQRS